MKVLIGRSSENGKWMVCLAKTIVIALCLGFVFFSTSVEAKKISKPSTPKSVKVKLARQTSKYSYIDVSWKKVKGAKGYKVTLSVKKGKKYKTISEVKTKKTKARIKTSQKGKVYFQVKAYKKDPKGKLIYGKASSRKAFNIRSNNGSDKTNSTTEDNKNDNKNEVIDPNKPDDSTDKDDASSDNTNDDEMAQKYIDEVLKYSYEIIPLTDSVCTMFYVKTDNPDPRSFYFADYDTIYGTNYRPETGKNRSDLYQDVFEYGDVEYENVETLRVKGGYIFTSDYTDGGAVSLVAYIGPDTGSYRKSCNTGKVYNIPRIYSQRDYLINTYTSSDKNFWENMDAVSEGLHEICFYTGPSTRGQVVVGNKIPFLMKSPFQDKGLELLDTYSILGQKQTLISHTYPFFLQSLAYPALLREVALAIEPNVIVDTNTGVHYSYKYTLDGESRYYGGAGYGKGQSIPKDMFTYKYSFDGDTYDMSTTTSWPELREVVQYYMDIEVPDQFEGIDVFTWDSVGETLSPYGDYVKIVVSSEKTGFAYMVNKGWAISDSWFDGRYFNAYEVFEKGAKFTDPELSKKTIYLKDFEVPLPPLGENEEYDFGLGPDYNIETGKKEGVTYFGYDEETDTWNAIDFVRIVKKDADGNIISYEEIEDYEPYFDALTITREEANQMGIDKNTDSDPDKYLIYDKTAQPGTRIGY